MTSRNRALLPTLLVLFALPLAAHKPDTVETTGHDVDDGTKSWALYGAFDEGDEVFTIRMSFDTGFALPFEVLVPRHESLADHRPRYAVLARGLPVPSDEVASLLPRAVPEGMGVFVEVNDAPERHEFYEPFSDTDFWTSEAVGLMLDAGQAEIWVWSPAGTTGDFRAAEPIVGPLRPLFVLSCLANGAWIFAWHYLQLGLSVVLMLVLLGSLIAVYVRMHPPDAPAVRPLFRWTLFVPIGLYLGWICVAVIPNVSALLLQHGWDGAPLAGPTWAALMMAVATALLVTLAIRFRDIAPPLVLIWALVGIIVKFPDEGLMRAVGFVMVAVLTATVGFLSRAWPGSARLRSRPSS